MKNRIYLDNSATTKQLDEVAEYIENINIETYGNPSSLHRMGMESEKLIKRSRETISKTLNVEKDEIFFTSGGTESNNLAILGYLKANPRKGNHIITTAIEHPSVLEVYKHLEKNGYIVDYIGVDRKGMIDLKKLEDKITEKTAIISIMHVNNEVGCIQNLDQIAKIKNYKNKETTLHVDAVQSYGKIKIFPKDYNIDLLSISSHKIHGPKGVGALFVNKKIKLKPLFFGGGQELSIRSGTENVPGIAGFGIAADLAFKEFDLKKEKIADLKKIFIEKLKSNIDNFEINSPDDSSPYILSVSFFKVRAEVLLHHLEEKNIFVSTGSACSSRKNMHSHVLKAMNVEPSRIEGTIRFSFSIFNNEDEIDFTVNRLKEILDKLRR